MLDPLTRRLITKFTQVGRERVQTITALLMQIAPAPTSHPEELKVILGELHTLKGEAKILGLDQASEVAHGIEKILKKLQKSPGESGESEKDLDPVERLFQWKPLFQCLDEIIHIAEATLADKESSVDVQTLLAQLEHSEDPVLETEQENLAHKEAEPTQTPLSENKKAETIPLSLEKWEGLITCLESVLTFPESMGEILTSLEGLTRELKEVYQLLMGESKRELSLSATGVGAPQRSFDRLLSPFLAPADMEENLPILKVARKIKRLLNGHQRLRESASDLKFEMEIKTEEILNQNLSLRLMPLSLVTSPFARGVFEMAEELGKKVRFIQRGMETEMDRKILEKLGEPLLHLIRNGVDHGIEPPSERKKVGKNPQGRLSLTARLQGAEVVISLSDDGRGIDREELVKCAIQKEFITREEASRLNELEKLELIFCSGLSTQSKTSQISGRGVGMEVAKRTVENMGARLYVSSEKGRGTDFEIHLPLSLSLVSGLVVRVASLHLLLSSQHIAQVNYLDEIRIVNDVEMISFQERLLPLQWLHTSLGISPPGKRPTKIPLVILNGDNNSFSALMVDGLLGEREVLLKPFNSFLVHHPLFSSAGSLEGGEMAYLLNVTKLGQTALPKEEREETSFGSDKKTILIVEDSPITREMEKTILESFGYEILEAENGKRALEILKTTRPHLVISDVEMPEMGGLELIKRIRQNSTLIDLPCVIVSTRDSREDRQAGLSAGADAYLVKGEFQSQSLLEMIQRWI